jgi:phage terminase Nu1 subunit (DNA packaging protein)
MKKTPIVNAKQFAKIVDRSQATVSSWIRAGMPCVSKRRSGDEAKIDMRDVLPWLTKRFGLVEPNGAGSRLMRARAERFERQNADEGSSLIEVREELLAFETAIRLFESTFATIAASVSEDSTLRKAIQCEIDLAAKHFADALRAPLAGAPISNADRIEIARIAETWAAQIIQRAA